jgi:hypothetical protein
VSKHRRYRPWMVALAPPSLPTAGLSDRAGHNCSSHRAELGVSGPHRRAGLRARANARTRLHFVARQAFIRVAHDLHRRRLRDRKQPVEVDGRYRKADRIALGLALGRPKALRESEVRPPRCRSVSRLFRWRPLVRLVLEEACKSRLPAFDHRDGDGQPLAGVGRDRRGCVPDRRRAGGGHSGFTGSPTNLIAYALLLVTAVGLLIRGCDGGRRPWPRIQLRSNQPNRARHRGRLHEQGGSSHGNCLSLLHLQMQVHLQGVCSAEGRDAPTGEWPRAHGCRSRRGPGA